MANATGVAGKSRRATAPRRRLRPPERRAALVEAAAALVAEAGLKGVTVEAIAARAGVTKPVVYAHFDNAAEVLLELMEREHVTLDAAVAAGLEKASTFEERLRALSKPYFDRLQQRGSLFRALVVERSDRALLERWQSQRRDAVVAFLAAMVQDETGLEPPAAELAAAALLGAFEAAVQHWWLHPDTKRAAAEAIFETVVLGAVAGLRTKGQRARR